MFLQWYLFSPITFYYVSILFLKAGQLTCVFSAVFLTMLSVALSKMEELEDRGWKEIRITNTEKTEPLNFKNAF